jgi:predicted PurR-regulated permease PerM
MSGAEGRPGLRHLGPAATLSLQLLLVTAAVALVLYVLVTLRLVVLPVIFALLVATVLAPPAGWLRRRGVPATLAALGAMLGALTIAAGVVAFVVPTAIDELDEVGATAREGLDEVVRWLTTGPLDLSRAQLDRGVDQALERLRGSGEGLAGSAARGALLVAEVVAGVLLAAVLLFFFLKDGRNIWDWTVRLFPARRHEVVRGIGSRAWDVLTAYVRGVAIVALFDAVAIGVALWIIGVPLVIPLALLTFVGAFVPLAGAVIAGAVAALVALVTVGVVPALLVVAAVTVVQQVEGDLLYPLVVGRSLELHPVAVLLALTAGAVLAGIVGALLAVPTAAVAWTAYTYLRERAGGAPA